MRSSTRRLVIFLLLLSGMLPLQARHLMGRVVDAKSHEYVAGATVELLSAVDSSLIRSVVTQEADYFGMKIPEYNIEVENNTRYILRFSMIGFKTVYRTVEVRMADRVNEQRIDDVTFEEDTRTLSEVLVKATKIKMVMRGDTVVYDASAFNLSEGSMLDALIRQMPGATLENGIIKVNGRTVSSLLVNGRDFFKGDARKALENLPAYTVDKVKVYDKQGRASRLMGRDMDDRAYVLDVALKKQYLHGYLANAELAGGTDNRYSGKLFSMFYTRHSRLTLTGSMNNLNNQSTPGSGELLSTMPEDNSGQTTTKQAGVAYRYEGAAEDDYFESENSFLHTDDVIRTHTTSQTYLAGGDYYDLNRNGRRAKNTTWSSQNSFGLTPGNHLLAGDVRISHSENQGWGNGLSGRFSADPGSMATLDSLFAPDNSQKLLAMTVNRVRRDNQTNGSGNGYQLALTDMVKFGTADSWQNMASIAASLSYSTSRNHTYALNMIDYYGDQPSQDHRNQYTEAPNRNYNFSLNADYTRVIDLDSDKVNTLMFRPGYRYTQTYSSDDNDFFRLDRLADYTDEAYALGVLPSTRTALMQVIDSHNSYRSSEHGAAHSASLVTMFVHGDGTRMPRFSMTLNLPFDVKREHISYYRERSYDRRRTSVLFSPSANLVYMFNDSTGTRYAQLGYNSMQSQPSLLSLLDIRDDANPLAVTLGNPDLRMARSHSINLSTGIFRMRSQQNIDFGIDLGWVDHAIATAARYDKQTGITTTQQVNVEGNWNAGASLSLNKPIDRKKHLSLMESLSSSYNTNIDLMSAEGSEAERSKVHNLTATYRTALSYQLDDRFMCKLSGNATYRRATGDRSDFQTVSAWDYGWGISGNARLPWKLHLSTDFNCYYRRGYNDDEMNTSETVWSVRLSRALLEDKLSVSLDAFDILGQLTNTSYTLDEQGHRETWTNSLSRFVMFRVAYKFGKK